MTASWSVYGTISFPSVRTENESLGEQPRRWTNGSIVGYEVTLPVRALWSHVICSSAVEALDMSDAIFTLRLL